MKSVRVYPYRWVVLGALMAVIMASEMQWLVLAPISRVAAHFYRYQIPHDSFIGPDLLTLIHLISFVIVSIPISYLSDKLGLKISLRVAALFLTIFSLIKGFWATSFTVVVIAQLGLSIAHAIILNNITLVTARWFPIRERGFATGLVMLAQYLGLMLIMIISPLAVVVNPQAPNYGAGITSLLFWLGIANAIGAVAVLFFFKERPPTPSSREPIVIESFVDSFKLLKRKKHMGGFMVIFGLVWALFNVFIAKIDSITAFVGIESSSGLIGVVLLGGGMAGSIIIPLLSDYLRKRRLLFFISMVGIFGGVLLFASIPLIIKTSVSSSSVGYIAAALVGFFFQSAIPLGYQYASELSFPAQESSSQGVLLIVGHLMGILLLVCMTLQGGEFLEHVLIASVTLLFAATLGVLFLKESPVIITEEERLQAAVEKERVRHS